MIPYGAHGLLASFVSVHAVCKPGYHGNGTHCVECPENKYCLGGPLGNSTAQDCPAGSSLAGSDEETDCGEYVMQVIEVVLSM